MSKLVCKSDLIEAYSRLEIDIPPGEDYLWVGIKNDNGIGWKFLGSISSKVQLNNLLKMTAKVLKKKSKRRSR